MLHHQYTVSLAAPLGLSSYRGGSLCKPLCKTQHRWSLIQLVLGQNAGKIAIMAVSSCLSQVAAVIIIMIMIMIIIINNNNNNNHN